MILVLLFTWINYIKCFKTKNQILQLIVNIRDNLEEKTGTDNDSDLNNIIDDGVYKLRHKRSFKVSENVFSTFNSIVEKPEI